MAGKPVACDGDVKATAGSTPMPGTTGTWSAGSVSCEPYDHLTVGGVKVVWQAKCTFTYGNVKTTSSPPVSQPDVSMPMTFTASASVLQDGSTKVLLDGEVKEDAYKNKLEVKSSRVLKSA